MTNRGQLWAPGSDRVERAAEVRKRGDPAWRAALHDRCGRWFSAIRTESPRWTERAVRGPDREPRGYDCQLDCGDRTGVRPHTEAGVGALVVNTDGTPAAVIDEEFISEVERLFLAGDLSAVALDEKGDMDASLQGIPGLGGDGAQTTVDLKRAGRIHTTLATSAGAFEDATESQWFKEPVYATRNDWLGPNGRQYGAATLAWRP
jgi:hypothetical protein